MKIDLGLFLLRVGVGAQFAYQGYMKFAGGLDSLRWVGSQITLVGIPAPDSTPLPAFFGICAALAELLGGSLLIVGWFVRPAVCALLATMVVAVAYNAHAHGVNLSDPLSFMGIFYPGTLGLISLAMLFTGPGSWSIQKD